MFKGSLSAQALRNLLPLRKQTPLILQTPSPTPPNPCSSCLQSASSKPGMPGPEIPQKTDHKPSRPNPRSNSGQIPLPIETGQNSLQGSQIPLQKQIESSRNCRIRPNSPLETCYIPSKNRSNSSQIPPETGKMSPEKPFMFPRNLHLGPGPLLF